MRRGVGPDSPAGIKLNFSDGLEGGLSEVDALAVVERVDATSVDLIDICGGTYFPGTRSASDSGGDGPYFDSFARRARQRTTIPLMVTAWYKRRAEAAAALASGDVVGLGHALVIDPDLPTRWLGSLASRSEVGGSDPVFPRFE